MKSRISNVRHDAETGCFEAEVTLIDGTDSFTYSVAVPAPITAEVNQIMGALDARARTQHSPSRCTLTRSRASADHNDHPRDVATNILFSQPNYLQNILGRLAA